MEKLRAQLMRQEQERAAQHMSLERLQRQVMQQALELENRETLIQLLWEKVDCMAESEMPKAAKETG